MKANWIGHVARMEQKRTAYRSLMERDCLQNLVIDGRINLKLIFKNGMGGRALE
jgi:hypothetical protein